MDLNKYLQSKSLKIIIFSIFAIIVILGAFKLGEFVGYRKAGFSYRWGEYYNRNFAGPRGGLFGNFGRNFNDRGFINAHGTFGTIIKIDLSTSSEQAATIIVKGNDNVEKNVLVSGSTVIREGWNAVKVSDLKLGEGIVIIGSPNDQGQIEAKFIRVFDGQMVQGPESQATSSL